MRKALTFDDVLLKPKHSTVDSRSNVDISTHVTPSLEIDYPFVSAPMDTVTGPQLARELADAGGVGVIPRHGEYEAFETRIESVAQVAGPVGVAIGLDEVNTELLKTLEAFEADFICVDTAHGHLSKMLDSVYEVSEAVECDVMAGNIATAQGAIDLYEAGADAIKVGIGPGSACTTRERTGVGVPQITATQNVKEALKRHTSSAEQTPSVITDGGMRTAGDMMKALMAGADAVMHGRLFAECDEAPNDGEMYGLASDQIDGSGATEGETRDLSGEQPYVVESVDDWAEAIRSGVSYCGGYNLHEARRNAEFVQITSNAVERNGVH
jgi:IMP dehydrogenase